MFSAFECFDTETLSETFCTTQRRESLESCLPSLRKSRQEPTELI